MSVPSLLLTPGTVLGRYELLLPIAQGGMAMVWAARQTGSRGFEKVVAIKTMLANLSENPHFEQMFLNEAALAARIRHPNVVEILDLGEENGVLFIAMEWIDGETLAGLIKSTVRASAPFPMRIALKLIADMAAGLAAAHGLTDDDGRILGIVHRDVSPQNVIVTFDGFVKVVDFGIAKVGTLGGATRTGELKGKIPYMSPEQARGDAVDLRTDIFALGTILYRLVTGLHPFVGDNDVVTLQRIAGTPATPLRAIDPAIPAIVDAIVMRCLEKDAASRFQHMGELGTALNQALAQVGAVPNEEVGAFVKQYGAESGLARRTAIRSAWKRPREGVYNEPSHDGGTPASFPFTSPRFTPPGSTGVSRPSISLSGAFGPISGPSSSPGSSHGLRAPTDGSTRLDSNASQRTGSTLAGNAVEAGGRPPQKRLLLWVTVSCVCAIGLAGGAWLLLSIARTPRPEASASAPTVAATPADTSSAATPPTMPSAAPSVAAPSAAPPPSAPAVAPPTAPTGRATGGRIARPPPAETAKPWVQPGGGPDLGF